MNDVLDFASQCMTYALHIIRYNTIHIIIAQCITMMYVADIRAPTHHTPSNSEQVIEVNVSHALQSVTYMSGLKRHLAIYIYIYTVKFGHSSFNCARLI